jgi:hypothetical protein
MQAVLLNCRRLSSRLHVVEAIGHADRMARTLPRSRCSRPPATGWTEAKILKQFDWIVARCSVLLDLTSDVERFTTRWAGVRRRAAALGRRLRQVAQAGRKPDKPTCAFRFPPVPPSLSESNVLQRVRRCALEARDMIRFPARQPTY